MKDLEMFIDALNNLPADIQHAKYGGVIPGEQKKKGPVQRKRFDKTIDLHGLTKHEALMVLHTTLRSSKGKSQRILIITGKGNHSQDGQGVIRESVRSFLMKAGSMYIREFRYAERLHGGDGAFDVITK
jgi:DNA-nicking Smr family endonuclease